MNFVKNDKIYNVVNSRFGSDKNIGGTTCKNSSTVDYVLATTNVFRILQNFDVIDFCDFYSDVHNPISFSFSYCSKEPTHSCIGENHPSVKLWCPGKADDFCNNIDRSAVISIDNKLHDLSMLGENISRSHITNITRELCDVFFRSS